MMESVIFYLFSGIALLAAAGVVLQKRVFYAAVSLIVCLCAVAVLYVSLEAPFMAAVQVIVYAGAIMVLFLIVIMLLDPFSAAVLEDKRKSLRVIAVLLGALLCTLLVPFLTSYRMLHAPRGAGLGAEETGSVENIGRVLFDRYLLPFEATSVLILVAIIGVVILVKRQKQS